MIIIGIDPHMKTHTAVALDAVSGRKLGEKTVACDQNGHDSLLTWARGLSTERALPSRTAAPSRVDWSATFCRVVSGWCACRPS